MTRITGEQFSLSALFVLTAALAGLLGAFHTFPVLAQLGPFAFWVVLLTPLWGALLSLDQTARWGKARVLISLIPSAWYLILVEGTICSGWLFRFALEFPVGLKCLILLGTVAALCSLGLCVRRWMHVMTAPLWIAIFAGTVSLFRLLPR